MLCLWGILKPQRVVIGIPPNDGTPRRACPPIMGNWIIGFGIWALGNDGLKSNVVDSKGGTPAPSFFL